MTLSQVIAGDLPRFLQFSEWLCIIVSLTAHSWRRNFGICFGPSKISVILFLLIFSRASEIYMFVKRNGRMIPVSPLGFSSINQKTILNFQSPLTVKIPIYTEIVFASIRFLLDFQVRNQDYRKIVSCIEINGTFY